MRYSLQIDTANIQSSDWHCYEIVFRLTLPCDKSSDWHCYVQPTSDWHWHLLPTSDWHCHLLLTSDWHCHLLPTSDCLECTAALDCNFVKIIAFIHMLRQREIHNSVALEWARPFSLENEVPGLATDGATLKQRIYSRAFINRTWLNVGFRRRGLGLCPACYKLWTGSASKCTALSRHGALTQKANSSSHQNYLSNY